MQTEQQADLNRVFTKAVQGGESEKALGILAEHPGLKVARAGNGETVVQLAVYFGHRQLAEELHRRIGHLDFATDVTIGDVAAVKAALDEDGDKANEMSPDGLLPLCLAVGFGNTAVAKLLIEAGADVNGRSTFLCGVAPIHSAIFGRSYECIKLLLQSGADVNLPQSGGFTPLHGAAQNGDVAVVKLLLEHGADSRAETDEGKTARDFAGGNAEILKALGL